ncbi:metallophosphoesterase [Cerasicoccus maritimus]|uniref:metallophosphoesterase n=1 Tax=Cerasicoccus maritimus TaxID=490089 RepID=UPI0028527E2D|nr:metallophosphoesterase [Cerasicoccus maritimus]
MTHPGKIYAIGDVHGCSDELNELLTLLELGQHDMVVFVGDLVNRGPNSREVLRIARNLPGCYCLLGNHELRLLKYRDSKDRSILKDYDWETIPKLGDEDWRFMREFHLNLHFPGLNTVIVHGGFLPNIPWDDQEANVVTQIQVYNKKTGSWGKRADISGGESWMKYWHGPPFVVSGHTPRSKVVRTKWSICIDTGCAYGGHLTAFELTERKIYQVKARQTYVSKSLSDSI